MRCIAFGLGRTSCGASHPFQKTIQIKRPVAFASGLFICMARSGGFEPPTAWFVARYSIQLSYERVVVGANIRGFPRGWQGIFLSFLAPGPNCFYLVRISLPQIVMMNLFLFIAIGKIERIGHLVTQIGLNEYCPNIRRFNLINQCID